MMSLTVLRAVLAAFVVGTGCAPSDETMARRHQARRDSVAAADSARFGRPVDFSRGTPDSVLTAPVAVRVAAYAALFPQPYLGVVERLPGEVPAEHRPWLQAEFLSHEGAYAEFRPMDEPLLHGLLATERFRGACGGPRFPVCPDSGATIQLFSALYRVGPGVLRVFRAERSGGFAQEDMFRLEHRGETWTVADRQWIMIT